MCSRLFQRALGRAESGPGPASRLDPPRAVRPPEPAPTCNRCGFPVSPRAWGCKNPCANCGTVYPIGDCSD